MLTSTEAPNGKAQKFCQFTLKPRFDNQNSFDRYYFTYVLTSNRLAPNLTVQLYHYRVCCVPQIEGKSSSNFSHYSKKMCPPSEMQFC